MAKTLSSAIGVDLGRHSVKAVLLHKRGGNRVALSSFAVQPAMQGNGEQLEGQLGSLLQQLGGRAKGCSIALSTANGLLKIIEQPETPVELLRDVVRLNGLALLNQDCKDFVLDCQPIDIRSNAPSSGNRRKYVVGGVPRTKVLEIDMALQKCRTPLKGIQLAPIASFNAFEASHSQIFDNEAFILVDIGHLSSTVALGVKKQLVMIRSIDYGGKALTDTLTGGGTISPAEAFRLFEEGDAVAVENATLSLTALTREISGSIGFFEGQSDEAISRIFVSGGPAKSKMLLKLIGTELYRPCELWDPFEQCDVNLNAAAKERLNSEIAHLNVAFGAAAELLNGS
jgi:type IV pilus assembly protein PilM